MRTAIIPVEQVKGTKLIISFNPVEDKHHVFWAVQGNVGFHQLQTWWGQNLNKIIKKILFIYILHIYIHIYIPAALPAHLKQQQNGLQMHLTILKGRQTMNLTVLPRHLRKPLRHPQQPLRHLLPIGQHMNHMKYWLLSLLPFFLISRGFELRTFHLQSECSTNATTTTPIVYGMQCPLNTSLSIHPQFTGYCETWAWLELKNKYVHKISWMKKQTKDFLMHCFLLKNTYQKQSIFLKYIFFDVVLQIK